MIGHSILDNGDDGSLGIGEGTTLLLGDVIDSEVHLHYAGRMVDRWWRKLTFACSLYMVFKK